MRFDLLKLGRVLRDVDERDAGGGSSVDPLDIFSMDFEGDSNRDEEEKTSSQGGETPTTEGNTNPQTDGNVEQGTESSNESSNNLEKLRKLLRLRRFQPTLKEPKFPPLPLPFPPLPLRMLCLLML